MVVIFGFNHWTEDAKMWGTSGPIQGRGVRWGEEDPESRHWEHNRQ